MLWKLTKFIFLLRRHVLRNVGISDSVYAVTGSKEYALHSLRVSISHLTTKDELEEFVRVLKKCICELSFQVGEGNA